MKTTTDKNKITLRVDGQIYEGWKSARVETSIDQICRAFVLSVTDNFPGNTSFTRLKPGQLVELYVGDEKVCFPLPTYVKGTGAARLTEPLSKRKP